jgi:hypothetical protein
MGETGKSPVMNNVYNHFNYRLEMYREVARWQQQLHSSLAAEMQISIQKHLDKIAQVI